MTHVAASLVMLKIFVRDQAGHVIHLQELTARGAGVMTAATTTFRPRTGTTSITAYAYCNLHDLWADIERQLA